MSFLEYLNFNKLSKPNGLFFKSPNFLGGEHGISNSISERVWLQCRRIGGSILGTSFQQNFFGFDWGGKSITKTWFSCLKKASLHLARVVFWHKNFARTAVMIIFVSRHYHFLFANFVFCSYFCCLYINFSFQSWMCNSIIFVSSLDEK